jgi:hypothetical protein
MQFTDDGQPIYGPRDAADLDLFRKLGLPFWLAGGYGSADKFQEALAHGAAGVQVGTPFALCVESGLDPALRRAFMAKALAGKAKDLSPTPRPRPPASPSRWPNSRAPCRTPTSMPGAGASAIWASCAKPTASRMAPSATAAPPNPRPPISPRAASPKTLVGRKCLCNALVANVGMPQRLPDGSAELPLVTLGDDFENVARFCATAIPTSPPPTSSAPSWARVRSSPPRPARTPPYFFFSFSTPLSSCWRSRARSTPAKSSVPATAWRTGPAHPPAPCPVQSRTPGCARRANGPG